MSSILELKQLQKIDAELAARRQVVQEIQQQWDDTAALQELREQVPQARRRLAEWERQQRDAEWEVEATRELLKRVEAKLYGGRVNNPKELMGLHEEATMLKARQQRQEDAVLEVMVQLEEQQGRCAQLERALAQAEQQRHELEVRLIQQRNQLYAELEQLNLQREALAPLVPEKDLQLYTTLLATKQGRALAGVERATCQGCRISVPMTVQQRVRTDQGLVQCPSCGRILFMD